MLVFTTVLLPLWILALGLVLCILFGAGLVWRSAVIPLTTQTIPRLRHERHQLYTTLLSLRSEAGHAVRAHYDEGLNTALRHADHVVFALPSSLVCDSQTSSKPILKS